MLNTANEVLVEAFLNREIAYLDIVRGVKDVLDNFKISALHSIEDVIAADHEIRTYINKDNSNKKRVSG